MTTATRAEALKRQGQIDSSFAIAIAFALLCNRSRHVRHLFDALQKAGHEPLKYDLFRCRQLAKVESLIKSGT